MNMRAGGDAGRFWKEHEEEEEEGRKMGKMRSLLAADGNGFGERSRFALSDVRVETYESDLLLLLLPPPPRPK